MKRLLRGWGAALLVLGLTALPALAASESLPEIASSRISGSEPEGRLGQSLDAAGDFNGDGTNDLVVGGDGRAFVVMGGAPGDFTAAATEERSVELRTAVPGRRQTLEVAGAGDIDGDGLGDVLVGVETADPFGRRDAGSVFLVFGRPGTAPVILDAAEAQRVVRIDGAAKGDHLGASVARAGDVDGDEIPDLIVGARLADDGTGKKRGAAYVLFGGLLNHSVDLAEPENHGFVVRSPSFGRSVGASVARAGDMNGDGFGDVIVGAPSSLVIATPAAYVVFGKASTDDVVLGALGEGGFLITAGDDERQEGAGEAVGGGHDVNADGIPDVVVGAPVASGRYSGTSGSAYIIFGKPDNQTVRLNALEDAGFEVRAGQFSQSLGESVALIPDRGNDGFDDILVGDPGERSGYGRDVVFGAIYHLAGQSSTTSIDAGRLGKDGVRYRGRASYDMLGASVADIGDFDGDGAPDLAVGAPRSLTSSASEAGMVYVFSPVPPPVYDNPPAAELVSYFTRQQAQRGSFCWDARCVKRSATFPKADLAGAGDEARFRISFDEKPEQFALSGYREVDDSGSPTGPREEFSVTLEPLRHYRGAPIAGYEAIFDLPKEPGNLYLLGFASWPGEEPGDVTWYVHLNLSREAAYTDIPSPPKATLLSEGGTRQRGAIISYCWSRSFSNGTGVSQCSDGIRTEPRKAEPARAGATATIRIDTKYRPGNVRLRLFREHDSGYPSGPSTTPEFRLKRYRPNGETIAWDVIFRLPERAGNLYPTMNAGWDQHGSAPYDWRLRLR